MRLRFAVTETKLLPYFGVAVLALLLVSGESLAQSGSRAPVRRPSGSSTRGSTARSGSINQVKPLAMNGYCTVCIHDMKKWMRGDRRFSSVFDGKTYLFPGLEQKRKFDAKPAKYAPVLGGDCVVAFKDLGQRVPGKLEFGAYRNDRLYFFASQSAKDKFMANPEAYENIDLALNGRCVVCRMDMGQEVQGKPEFEVTFQGMRYWFPGQEQQNTFRRNPVQYRARPTAPSSRGSERRGSSSR